MAYSASFPIPENMRDTINNCTAGLGAVGVIGGAIGPGADLGFIIPTWIAMAVTLACQAGQSMEEQTAKRVGIAVATGLGGIVGGTKVASTVLGWLFAIPSAGLSVAASMAANAALNAKFTHAYGNSLARYFLQTEGIDSTDAIISVLIALTGLEFGIKPGSGDVTP